MILVSQNLIDDYVSKGWWGHETLGERFIHTAHKLKNTFAVADPPNLLKLTGQTPRKWSWEQLLEKVGHYTAFFYAEGIRADDVIVVQLPNTVDLQAIYLACAISGIIISPVPMQYRAYELEHVLQITQARYAITVAKLNRHAPIDEWLAILEKMETVEKLWCFGLEKSQHHEVVQPLEKSLAIHPCWSEKTLLQHLENTKVTANDVLTICWTSGTEAKPKGVPRSHNEWFIVGNSVIDAGQLKKGDHLLIPYPFVNMAGISTCLVAWLMIEGALYHHHPFDIDVFVQQLKSETINYAVSAPAVLTMLLKDEAQLDRGDFSFLKRIGSGGGLVSDWLVEQYYERFGVELVNYYGSNEGAALASTPQDIPNRAHRAQFFPRYGVPSLAWSVSNSKKVSTRLVSLETGAEICSPDQVGELRFKGPTIFSGYYNSPELSEKAFDEKGYYCTGDLFEIAGPEQQYYRFVGRSKDIVVRGGMNISSEEIESLLLDHPSVCEVAVIGWPDKVLGERVCAVVVPKKNQQLKLDALIAHLRNKEKIATFKLPEKLVLVESLPKNLLGKVLKRELRKELFTKEEVA